MSDRLKAKLGDELYNQILAAGLKPSEFDLVEGWIPKTRFDEVGKELKIVKTKVTSLEEQNTKYSDLVKDNEDLKTKFGTLKTQYETDLKNKDVEIGNIYKTTKFENELLKEGCKHPELFMSRVDFSKMTLENDNLIGATDVIKGFKESYSEYFKTQQTNTTNQTQGSKQPDANKSAGDTNWDEVLKTF